MVCLLLCISLYSWFVLFDMAIVSIIMISTMIITIMISMLISMFIKYVH